MWIISCRSARLDSFAVFWNQWKHMKKAVLYARVSSDLQKKERTIESQIAVLKSQIKAAGDVLVKEYIDDGYSGARLDRPALDELRRDLKAPLFDSIYFLNTDRIARDVTYQIIIIGEILKHRKRLIINGRDYVENPENKFTLTRRFGIYSCTSCAWYARLTSNLYLAPAPCSNCFSKIVKNSFADCVDEPRENSCQAPTTKRSAVSRPTAWRKSQKSRPSISAPRYSFSFS
jgi:hypothetical protein